MSDTASLISEARLLLNSIKNPSKFKNEAPVGLPPLHYGLPPVFYAKPYEAPGTMKVRNYLHVYQPKQLPTIAYDDCRVILHNHGPLLSCFGDSHRYCHELGFTSDHHEFRAIWGFLYPNQSASTIRLDLSL